MKRSDINSAIQISKNLLRAYNIFLPQFASWQSKNWKEADISCKRIVLNSLGWDVTDFGRGDFDKFGAVLFTLRNGNTKFFVQGTPYAEKIIILKPGQSIPLHFHWSKTEDIINRAGGILSIELYNAKDDDTIDAISPVHVFCDGCERVLKAGEIIDFFPGESITITPRIFHRFYANINGGMLVCGEISSINDDNTDNYFNEKINRFAAIEEDEEPMHLLCNEYPDIK